MGNSPGSGRSYLSVAAARGLGYNGCMVRIFLDESGFTGYDLFNEQQPAFVIASCRLDEKQAQDLKSQFFGKVRAAELKYSALSKRPAQQQIVIDFLRYVEDNKNIFKITVAHKRYALVCKCVDLLVETPAHEDGLDIYDRGFNLGLADLLLFALPAFGGAEFSSMLLLRFQEMLRLRTREAYDSFFAIVFQEHDNEELVQLLDWLKIAHFRYGYSLYQTIAEDALDLALTMTLGLMAEWRAEIPGAID